MHAIAICIWTIVIVSWITRAFYTAQITADQYKLSQLQNKIVELTQQNNVLQGKLKDYQSLQYVRTQAILVGFRPISNVVFVK